MPRLTRREIVPEDQIGVFHCIQRCVRRAFLCGFDHATQKNFDHRKTWIQNRLRQLASLFGIDVCGYAVMSNHLHVILRTRPDVVVVEAWSEEGVMIMITLAIDGKHADSLPPPRSLQPGLSLANG